MKKLLIMIFGLSLLFTGCGSEEKSVVDLASDLEKQEGTYLTTNENFVNIKDNILIKDKVSGLLSIAVYDFNQDDEDEVLVSKVIDNNIVMDLYVKEEDALKKADSIVLFENYLDSPDMMNLDCFVTILDEKPYIIAESIGYYNLTADGISWKARKIGVSDNKFISVVDDSFNGSYLDEEVISEKINSAKKLGLKIEKIVFDENGESLYNQNKDKSVMMYQIERKHIEGLFDKIDFNSKETKVKYGDTTYTNKLKDNYEIKAYLK